MPSEFIIAIHVLAYLRKEARQISSEELADNVCVNPVRIRKVLSKLKKAGIVETKVGLKGGYYLEIDKEIISLGKVYDALNIAITHTSWRSGDINKNCMISSGMNGVVDELSQNLEAACHTYLESLTIKDVLKKLESNYEKRGK